MQKKYFQKQLIEKQLARHRASESAAAAAAAEAAEDSQQEVSDKLGRASTPMVNVITCSPIREISSEDNRTLRYR